MRLRPALTPAAFFIGLALTCASLVEFARWTYAWHKLSSDSEVDLQNAVYVDVERVVQAFEWMPRSMSFLLGWWQLAAGLVGAAGLLLVILKRRAAGAWMVGLATVSGLVPAVLLGLEFTARPEFTERSMGCVLWSYVGPWLPSLLATSLTFLMGMSVLMAVAWLVAQWQAAGRLTPEAWVAAGIALMMIGLVVHYAEAAEQGLSIKFIQEVWPPRIPTPPARPTAWLALLAAAGLLLSGRPLYVSRFVSVTVLLCGALMMVPALAVIHDEQLAARFAHDSWTDRWSNVDSLHTTRCEESSEAQPLIRLDSVELEVRGEPLNPGSGSFDQELFERIDDQNRQFRALHEQAGDLPLPRVTWQLKIARDAPLSVIRRTLGALRRADVERVTLTHARFERLDTWTQPMIHRHQCGLTISLSDSGRPMSDFADWPSLVRTADQAAGPFQLDPR